LVCRAPNRSTSTDSRKLFESTGTAESEMPNMSAIKSVTIGRGIGRRNDPIYIPAQEIRTISTSLTKRDSDRKEMRVQINQR
jgi:hypothetical protein